MSPIDLGNLYTRLRTRVSIHPPNCCAEISLVLPADFRGELAFYRLVNWGYVLVNEAAKVPLEFLTNLPPLRADKSFRREVVYLRTYVSHNLDVNNTRDRNTYAFVHRWFKEACGHGTPDTSFQYSACCAFLAEKIREFLKGAVDACDLLDDPDDGRRLTGDLKARVDLSWEAHRFDPFLSRCAARLGNPGIDLLAVRKRHLEKWRSTLSHSDENERERVLEQQIEADLLDAIGNSLPLMVREHLQRIAGSVETTVAALLFLREAHRIGSMTLPEIIEFVKSETVDVGRHS